MILASIPALCSNRNSAVPPSTPHHRTLAVRFHSSRQSPRRVHDPRCLASVRLQPVCAWSPARGQFFCLLFQHSAHGQCPPPSGAVPYPFRPPAPATSALLLPPHRFQFSCARKRRKRGPPRSTVARRNIHPARCSNSGSTADAPPDRNPRLAPKAPRFPVAFTRQRPFRPCCLPLITSKSLLAASASDNRRQSAQHDFSGATCLPTGCLAASQRNSPCSQHILPARTHQNRAQIWPIATHCRFRIVLRGNLAGLSIPASGPSILSGCVKSPRFVFRQLQPTVIRSTVSNGLHEPVCRSARAMHHPGTFRRCAERNRNHETGRCGANVVLARSPLAANAKSCRGLF